MIKGSVHPEVVTVVNIYAPNIGTPKFIKQIITPEGRNSNTLIIGDFNTPLLIIDYPDRKTGKEIMDLTEGCKTFHGTIAEYTF